MFNGSGTLLRFFKVEITKHDLIQYTITGPHHPSLPPAHNVVYYHWNMIDILGRSRKVVHERFVLLHLQPDYSIERHYKTRVITVGMTDFHQNIVHIFRSK